jgi:hypothetical protein
MHSTRNNQSGSINILLVPLISVTVLLFASLGFGVWSFSERQSYKNDVDAKIDKAVAVAVKKAETQKDNEFLEKEKEPLKTYSAAQQFGNFTLMYPKTWSATVTKQGSEFDMIANPDVVSTANKDATYALRVEVVNTSYNQVVKNLDGAIKQGKLVADSYELPNVPDVVGLRADGEIANGKTGSAVYLPLRDKTIIIMCETEERIADFDGIILENFTFNP